MKMKHIPVILLLLGMLNCTSEIIIEKPPLAKVQVVMDNYFGKEIPDPYRYMEDMKDSVVIEWFKSQAEYSRRILDRIPGRQALIDKMHEFDKRKSSKIGYALEITDNDRYFYLKSTPEDENKKLYYRAGFDGPEVLLFDPKTFRKNNNQNYSIFSFMPSHDGTKIAFDVTPNGSEISVLLIMNVENKKLYPEQIYPSWLPAPSWLPDGNSFLYVKIQTNDLHDMERGLKMDIYIHIVGTDPKSDKVFFSKEKYPELDIEPLDYPYTVYDKNCEHIFVSLFTTDRRLKVYYTPVTEIKKEKIDWIQLCDKEDEIYEFTCSEDELFLYTPKDASNFKIIKTTLIKPDISNAKVIVPENTDANISSYLINKDGIYYTLSFNGVEMKLFHIPKDSEKSKEIELPIEAGSIYFNSKGYTNDDFWIKISGWTSDLQRYRYSLRNSEFILENLSSVEEYPEYEDLIVEELMIPSHDGTKVPLTLIYKKGIKKNGKNRVMLYGYGAYGGSRLPSFNPNNLLWTLEGGIYAVAHVRGGGELGSQWHKGGFKTTKPNTWKDLIACAEYLVNERYTSSKKIAIRGRSAGGILIGRAMTERPDLFAVAIPEVGWLNPLRNEEYPFGKANIAEFGTVKDSTECMALIEMDAYLHIKNGVNYPATLITAGMNDPRVIAWQPGKFTAKLQAANAADKPILFSISFESGHGFLSTKSKKFESLADILSFALWQTDHPHYQIK